MGSKSLDVLRVASLPNLSLERTVAYKAACERWSEKAVVAKFEELTRRGLITYGVSARTGWLTEKGKQILDIRRQQA